MNFDYKRAIQVSGIILIGIGITSLIHFIILMMDHALNKIIYKNLINIFAEHFWGISCLQFGYDIFRLKPKARVALLSIIPIFTFYLIISFCLLGIVGLEVKYLVSILIVGALTCFFNFEKVKSHFHYPKGKLIKWNGYIFFLLGLGCLVTQGYMLYQYNAFTLKPLNKGVLTTQEKRLYQDKFYRLDFPLDFTMAIPKEAVFQLNLKRVYIKLTPDSKESLVLENETAIQKAAKGYKDIPQLLSLPFENSYQWSKKFLSEPFGLRFAIIRSFSTIGNQNKSIKEYKIGNLNIFVEEAEKEGISKTRNAEFHIFNKNQSLGGGYIENSDEQTIHSLIASIQLNPNTSKTAEEYFHEGLQSVIENKIEKAKFSFASAEFLDKKNPHYTFHLGLAFYGNKNWSFAKEYFERTVSLQSDYPEAKQLLEEVKPYGKNCCFHGKDKMNKH